MPRVRLRYCTSVNASPGVDDQIRAALRRLAPDARRVLVATSGGSDSVAVLRALAADPDLDVVAAHLDHRLRPTSHADATWVADTCAELGVPLAMDATDVRAVRDDVGGNLEAVAREVRYAFLTRAAKAHACDVVATAHTRDDQAETVLLQLLRGTAHPRGIEPRRGSVVRPALVLGKADLRGWLDGLGQAWREDGDNRDLSRDRAWLRHEVLPTIERRRPGSLVRLARFADLQRDQAAFLAAEAARRFRLDAPARASLAAAPVALQREVLAHLVRDAGGGVDVAHLDAALAALPGTDPWRADLPGGVRLRIGRDRVDALPPPDPAPEPSPEPSPEPPPGSLAPAGEGTPDAVEVATPDALPDGAPATLLEDGPWRLRTARPGDRIRLSGGTRTVRDVLRDAGVPREGRDAVRVLARGDRVGWIDGVAVAEGHDPDAVDPDRAFMRRALDLAREAAAAGETPVGAVVVRDGVVLGEGRNAREADADPTAHAELVALRAAADRDGDWRLSGATLYVTLEPCPMCAGAMIQTHVERVVYGAPNPRDGAFGSVVDLAAGPFKRMPEVRGGVRASEARALLERFFAARRG